MKIFFYLLTLQFLIFASGCVQRKLPENAAELFSSWFVQPTEKKQKIIENFPLSRKIVDSLVEVVRLGVKHDVRSATELVDSFGTPYIIGYRTPESFSNDSSYPLIIYLHGGVGTNKNTKGEKAYDMFSFLGDSMKLFLASPSANRNAPWWSTAGLHRILQTLRFMSLNFPVDHQKVFLAGVSDGATGCYAAANTISSPFAGFFAVSGFGGMLPHLGMKLMPQNLTQRPIYNINAGNDRLYPISLVDDFLDSLEKYGVSVKRKVYPQEQHGFDYRSQELDTLRMLIERWSLPSCESVKWHSVTNFPQRADNLLSLDILNRGAAHITTYWRVDTLHISQTGARSFTIISPWTTNKRIRMMSGNYSGHLSPRQMSTLLIMEKMMHLSIPRVDNRVCYKINKFE